MNANTKRKMRELVAAMDAIVLEMGEVLDGIKFLDTGDTDAINAVEAIAAEVDRIKGVL